MVTLGATVSTLIPPTVVAPLFPALSTAVPVALLAPWAASVASGWQLAIPLTASLQSNWTVTGALYQPAALGWVVALPVIVGAVLSTSTVALAAVSVLPGLSTLQYVTLWVPSLVTLTVVPTCL